MMASITITITGITTQLVHPDEGDLATALSNIAEIIEAAADNALGTEDVDFDGLDVEIDEEL